jgi:signal transduction histidine kinase
VEDNGGGFDPNDVGAGHHGMLGMRLRMEAHEGSLRIESAPGCGIRLVATMPCTSAPKVS